MILHNNDYDRTTHIGAISSTEVKAPDVTAPYNPIYNDRQRIIHSISWQVKYGTPNTNPAATTAPDGETYIFTSVCNKIHSSCYKFK